MILDSSLKYFKEKISNFMKKFVIVTGGKGFIGYNLCNYLSKYYNVSIDNLI